MGAEPQLQLVDPLGPMARPSPLPRFRAQRVGGSEGGYLRDRKEGPVEQGQAGPRSAALGGGGGASKIKVSI